MQKDLLRIYKLFSLWAEDFDFACHKGCSDCCTQSVSMTMLEGELIYEYIQTERPELTKILENLPTGSSSPKTTNQFAAACLNNNCTDSDQDPHWNMATCVFLHAGCCTIYPVRSFMCRSLGSKVPCKNDGEATMDPLFLTLNTVIMQCIEHLDQGRPWGNMYSILNMIKETVPADQYTSEKLIRFSEPIPGFLIPPEEREQIQTQLQTLLKIIRVV